MKIEVEKKSEIKYVSRASTRANEGYSFSNCSLWSVLRMRVNRFDFDFSFLSLIHEGNSRYKIKFLSGIICLLNVN